MVRHFPRVAAMLMIGAAAAAPGQEAAPDVPPAVEVIPPPPPPPAGAPVQRVLIGQGRIVIRPAGEAVPRVAAAPVVEVPARDRRFASDVHHSGPIDPLVAALRSPQFGDRQDATTTLLRLSPERLPEVRSALGQEKDAEVIARLTQVAIHLYLKARTPLEGPASLLGITLDLSPIRLNPNKPEDLGTAVAVTELQPGFPAAQELRVGDLIVAIEGETFPPGMAITEFRQRVTSRYPGQVLPLTIVRNGKQMEVGVQLAGLPGAGAIQEAIEQRNAAMARFVASLETGSKPEPLMVNDKTPRTLRIESFEAFDLPLQR